MNVLKRIKELEKAVRQIRPIPGEGICVESSLAGTIISADDTQAQESTGMFDTALLTDEKGRPVLRCWNSATMEDDAHAGILSVNGQNFLVPRRDIILEEGKETFCWAVFQAPRRREESSTLTGEIQEDAPGSASLETTLSLMDSTPEKTFSLIAIVRKDGTLEKVRPRGIIEATWFGPARDLWKDAIETGLEEGEA